MDTETVSLVPDLSDDPILKDSIIQFRKRMAPVSLESYFSASTKRMKDSDLNPLRFLFEMAFSPSLHRVLQEPLADGRFGDPAFVSQCHTLLEMDSLVQKAFKTFGQDFPTAIWTCCGRRCFAQVAVLPENYAVFNVVLRIHKDADELHSKLEDVDLLIQSRRPSEGRSSIVHGVKLIPVDDARSITDRQQLRRELKNFIRLSLPYLRAEGDGLDGTAAPGQRFCIESICQILGVQRNMLYKPVSNEACLIDSAGVRQRKFRRIGSRKGFKEICQLPSFNCGCDVPCFNGLDERTLQRLWDGFKVIAAELSPEEKEHRYLMNLMFCPLTNTCVRVCNKAIAQLYTVSDSLVASVRLLIKQFCEDPAIERLPVRDHGMKRYREERHPLNRFPQQVIEQVERHLDMVLRPDPAAADGINVCRLYSPEVNTHEKLRKLIANAVKQDFRDVNISPSSLQRMIKSYLEERGCRISFSQSDHNACPMCKSYHCEILYLFWEMKQLSEKLSAYEKLPRPMDQTTQARCEEASLALTEEINLKAFRESEAVLDLRIHNERDARIRGWLKRLTDHLRTEENKMREDALKTGFSEPYDWCQRRNFALVTHQDDMTKVDLPHVVVESSADITRWRFDVNAHMNAVTRDCVVFSHEQGSGSKNASAILELILLDHIMTCKGENIKVVVSDNASVGKNWLSTVVFPQYLIDQGLADIVLIVFLENNHGKWLADMLFGQFQIRKRNCTILGVDGLLREFESINRPSGGRIRGYAVNPLGSVDFAQVFGALGYETKPPKDFGFKNRNVHFAGACRPGAKEKLTPTLQKLLANALPSEAGLVRLCTEPPGDRPYLFRRFEDRWIDVPASTRAANSRGVTETSQAPLVVSMDKEFIATGPGVVAKRTAEHVGFNGLKFRGKMSFPELGSDSYLWNREAWPPGLLLAGKAGYETESLRCAPQNWIVRRRVGYFGNDRDVIHARYPPRNMLNALYCHGPRARGIARHSGETVHWIPTATYPEPPFPVEERLSATEGLRSLARDNQNIDEDVNVLHLLRAVYEKMGNRGSDVDQWLQRSVTYASTHAFQRFNETLRLLKKRDSVRPRPLLTVFQAFRDDASVKEEVASETNREMLEDRPTRIEILTSLFEAKMTPQELFILRQDREKYDVTLQSFATENSTKRFVERALRDHEQKYNKLRTKLTLKLFDRKKLEPGTLDRFHRMVEHDKQRYARELKIYKQDIVTEFDEENNLLPIQGPLPRPS